MTKIRVMVVDGSVVVRRLIGDVLSGDPEIEVVATASNGRMALQRLEQTPCDLLTLDVDLPEFSVRRKYPKLPVVMFSAALANLPAARERIKTDLIPKIKALCGVSRSTSRIPLTRQITSVIPVTPPHRQTTSVIPVQRHTTGVIPVTTPSRTGVIDLPVARSRIASAVAIGVSTGGPPALQTLIGALPASLSVPVFIVQHMPPTFTAMLAERLARIAAVPVIQAVAGMRVEAGKVYVAPGDYHLVVDRGPMGTFLRTNQDPPVCSCRPSVDVLFRSVSAAYGASALAIVLTGMGTDGTRGAEYIRAGGGTVLAQDQATSVVWGMPGSVARAGLAAAVLPIGEIAGEIVSRTQMRARETATGR